MEEKVKWKFILCYFSKIKHKKRKMNEKKKEKIEKKKLKND